MRKQLLAAVGGGSVLDRTVIETSLTAGDGAAVTLDRLDLASCRSSACSTIP
jgi:hypothetical protein